MVLGACVMMASRPGPSATYLQALNKTLPHDFKQIHLGATLEAVREQEAVKLYLLIDDIEQYQVVMVERSNEQGTNFSQCKVINIEKGKYPNNYVEAVDRYPVSTKMSILYRIKTITEEGIVRMYPAVPITIAPATAATGATGMVVKK